jgi:hypothetical protein
MPEDVIYISSDDEVEEHLRGKETSQNGAKFNTPDLDLNNTIELRANDDFDEYMDNYYSVRGRNFVDVEDYYVDSYPTDGGLYHSDASDDIEEHSVVPNSYLVNRSTKKQNKPNELDEMESAPRMTGRNEYFVVEKPNSVKYSSSKNNEFDEIKPKIPGRIYPFSRTITKSAIPESSTRSTSKPQDTESTTTPTTVTTSFTSTAITSNDQISEPPRKYKPPTRRKLNTATKNVAVRAFTENKLVTRNVFIDDLNPRAQEELRKSREQRAKEFELQEQRERARKEQKRTTQVRFIVTTI